MITVRIKILLFALVMLPFALSATNFTIKTEDKAPAILFSIEELKSFLNTKNGFVFSQNSSNADWIIILQTSKTLPETAFSIKSYFKNKKQIIELTGATAKDVPSAVYTLLERMGFTFSFSGAILTGKLDSNSVKNYSETVVPVVKYRGIRQHINFPMDISSYSITDAGCA